MGSSVFAASSSVSVSIDKDCMQILTNPFGSILLCVYGTFYPDDISSAHSLVVYPETKGVPLEEMDAVFGEGESGTYSQR